MLIIGIDIGGTKIQGALISRSGKIMNKVEYPTNPENGPDYIISSVICIINVLTDKASSSIIGVGIGTAGQVSLEGEIIEATSTFPDWKGINLSYEVKKHTELPVFIVNDVQAMALGEKYFGEGKGVHNFLCLALGTGVGGGVICDGKLYRGTYGSAGEFGHLCLYAYGRSCTCGRKGCVEAYISGNALTKIYSEILGRSGNTYDLFNNAKNGGLIERKIINDFLQNIVLTLMTIASAFDPEKIIIGGGLSSALNPYYPHLIENLYLQKGRFSCEVVLSKLYPDVMLLGAASIFLENNFE